MVVNQRQVGSEQFPRNSQSCGLTVSTLSLPPASHQVFPLFMTLGLQSLPFWFLFFKLKEMFIFTAVHLKSGERRFYFILNFIYLFICLHWALIAESGKRGLFLLWSTDFSLQRLLLLPGPGSRVQGLQQVQQESSEAAIHGL